MRLKGTRIFIFVAIIVIATILINFLAEPVLIKLIRYGDSCHVRLSSKIAKKHSLDYYCSFDYPTLSNEISGNKLDSYSTKYDKGKYKGARKFEQGFKGKILLNYSWQTLLSNSKTLSFFFKPDKRNTPQTLLFFPSRAGADNVLSIENNVISLKMQIGKEYKIISKELPKKKAWNHVAICGGEKNISFYLNGKKVGEIPNNCWNDEVNSWICFGGKEELPYLGSVDELAIFSRELTEKEIKKIAKGFVGSNYSNNISSKTRLSRIARFLYSCASVGLRSTSRLNLFTNISAANSDELSIASLNFSKSDKKHFKIAHEESILSGRRISAASDFRKVYLSINHEQMECYAYLDEVYDNPNLKPRRPSYVIFVPEEGNTQDVIKPKRMFSLIPPELYALKHPDAESFLPNDYTKLVKLYTNNEYCGVYYLEEFKKNGRGWMISGEPFSRERILPSAHSGEPSFIENSELAKKYILSDVFFPWSELEVNAREKIHLLRKKELGYAGGGLHEFDLIGDNISPFMLKNSLSIPEGVKIIYSSNEQVIALDGKVYVDSISEPTFVNITAEVEKNGGKKDFLFRVVPLVSKLTSLSLWIDKPLQKNSKRDFLCDIQLVGQTNSVLNYGLVGSRSGIKHRGNTSYVRGRKRSVGIEFEIPHGVVGGDASRHLVLVSGYSDRTRLRNAFTFDVFRQMNPGINDAPQLDYVEVCVNGEYAGIYEAINRIDEFNISSNVVSALRIRTGSRLFGTYNLGILQEIVPRNNFGVGATNYLDTVKFVNETSLEEFSSSLNKKVIVENLADFYLLLNFTQNMDLIHVNQILCYDNKGRLSIVPWDCDKSFHDRGRFRIISNPLLNKCMRIPEFRALVKARWKLHRETILSDDAIDEWIMSKSDLIKSYMDYELDHVSIALKGEVGRTYPQEVEDFRKTVYFLREKVDAHINQL